MKKTLLGISLLTMGCLYGMLALVIILIFVFTDMPISMGILLSLGLLVLQFFTAPAINDFVFKHFYKMRFGVVLPEYLNSFIAEVCVKYNMKFPKIGFIDDGSPNAFTYGRTKNDARVVITRGLIELLNEDEVKTVVAHELGHVVHYDMIFMTVAQVVPLILYYVYQVMLESKAKSSRSNDNNNSSGYTALVGLVAYFLYIMSQYIILWLSRTREYYADSFAIEETRNPTGMANALVKIGFGLARGNKESNSKVSNGNALGISNAKYSKGIAIGAYNNGSVSKENIINAMKWERWNIWAKFNELNSTHPLISKRLLAISKRCEEFGQPVYIEFNEQRPESYLDDFLKELLIVSLPFIVIITTIIAMIVFSSEDNGILIISIGGLMLSASLFASLKYTHKNKDYKETNVADLLGEVKVSNITSVPCILEGKIIGRGNPGCIFNEDFVVQDETGIMFLDYNQPLHILEKIFAIFKAPENFNKRVKVKGWYRRGVVPYIEVHSLEVDGRIKKCHTYTTAKIIYLIIMAVSVFGVILNFIK